MDKIKLWLANYFAKSVGRALVPAEAFYFGDTSGGLAIGRETFKRDGWKRFEAFIRTTEGRVDHIDELRITEAAKGPEGGFATDFRFNGEARGEVEVPATFTRPT